MDTLVHETLDCVYGNCSLDYRSAHYRASVYTVVSEEIILPYHYPIVSNLDSYAQAGQYHLPYQKDNDSP